MVLLANQCCLKITTRNQPGFLENNNEKNVNRTASVVISNCCIRR